MDPASRVPYEISVCLARSSAELIGVSIRSMVKKAAKLAVYDDMMMSVKNHQALPTIRPAKDLLHSQSVNRQMIKSMSYSVCFMKHTVSEIALLY